MHEWTSRRERAAETKYKGAPPMYLDTVLTEEAEAALAEAETSRDASKKLTEETLAKLAAAEKRLLLAMEHCPANSGDGYTGCKALDRIAALEIACENATAAYKKAVQRNGDLSAEVARLKADVKEHCRNHCHIPSCEHCPFHPIYTGLEPARPDAVSIHYCAKCGSKALPSDIGPEYCPKCGEMPLMRLKPKRKRGVPK